MLQKLSLWQKSRESHSRVDFNCPGNAFPKRLKSFLHCCLSASKNVFWSHCLLHYFLEALLLLDQCLLMCLMNSRWMLYDPGWSWIRFSASEAGYVFTSAQEPRPHVTEILMKVWCVCVCSVWHWGQVSVYSSAGFVQDLSRKMQDSRALVKQLNTHRWLDPLWVHTHTHTHTHTRTHRERDTSNTY